MTPNTLSPSQEQLLTQLLEIINTACEASVELISLCNPTNAPAAIELVSDIQEVVRSVQSANNTFSKWLSHSYTIENIDNILDTLNDIQTSLSKQNYTRAAMKAEFQMYPFLCLLWESYYFWITIFPDPKRMEEYYQNEFAAHYSNPYIKENHTPELQLSIVVPVYNHLDVTKRCIEQLLKVTDLEQLNAELIFIDHGSTDGSLEYLESLGIGKIIHFKNNCRMYVFNTMAKIVKGKYLAFVSNDVMVTRNWAQILINCMESDPTIIAAAPATPNISNHQSLHLPNISPEEFVEWANGQNQSDQSKWDDRARLLPPLGFYRMEAVNKIGFADPYFHTMEFWDDDFSLRARRNGYRQILCQDIACYHFGSVTGSEAQKKEKTLQHGRELFQAKNHADAWKNGYCYDMVATTLFLQSLPNDIDINLLGIDCGFGDTPLQMRNELRRLHRKCHITNITCQKEYIQDLDFLSDSFAFGKNVTEMLSQIDNTFHCIYISPSISEYTHCMPLLQEIYNHLDDDGILIFTCKNPYNVNILHSLLTFSITKEMSPLCLLDPLQLNEEIKTMFSTVNIVKTNDPAKGIESFAQRYYGNIPELPHIVNKITADKFYYICKK